MQSFMSLQAPSSDLPNQKKFFLSLLVFQTSFSAAKQEALCQVIKMKEVLSGGLCLPSESAYFV